MILLEIHSTLSSDKGLQKKMLGECLGLVKTLLLMTQIYASKTRVRKITVPGTEVPRATIPIAVIASFSPIVQPTAEAMSPMKAVTKPMARIDTTNVG